MTNSGNDSIHNRLVSCRRDRLIFDENGLSLFELQYVGKLLDVDADLVTKSGTVETVKEYTQTNGNFKTCPSLADLILTCTDSKHQSEGKLELLNDIS